MLNLESPELAKRLAARLDDSVEGKEVEGKEVERIEVERIEVEGHGVDGGKDLPTRTPRSRIRPSREFATELSYGRHAGPPAHDARLATVIVLLYWQQDAWYIPLTLRPTHLQDHAGQVSFPGGAVERSESAWQAGSRELEEELGIGSDGIGQLGSLPSIYVFASNFLVTPFVAACDHRPNMQANRTEVAVLLEVPLTHLFDTGQRETRIVDRLGVRFQAKGIRFGDNFIWGATAAMLGSLMECIFDDSY